MANYLASKMATSPVMAELAILAVLATLSPFKMANWPEREKMATKLP